MHLGAMQHEPAGPDALHSALHLFAAVTCHWHQRLPPAVHAGRKSLAEHLTASFHTLRACQTQRHAPLLHGPPPLPSRHVSAQHLFCAQGCCQWPNLTLPPSPFLATTPKHHGFTACCWAISCAQPRLGHPHSLHLPYQPSMLQHRRLLNLQFLLKPQRLYECLYETSLCY